MYLLDANVFIQSYRAHYGFDVVLNVPCTGPYAMLREESARFVLGP